MTSNWPIMAVVVCSVRLGTPGNRRDLVKGDKIKSTIWPNTHLQECCCYSYNNPVNLENSSLPQKGLRWTFVVSVNYFIFILYLWLWNIGLMSKTPLQTPPPPALVRSTWRLQFFSEGANRLLFQCFQHKGGNNNYNQHHCCLHIKPKGNVYSVTEDRISKEVFRKMTNVKRHFWLKKIRFKFWNTQEKCQLPLPFDCYF